MTMPKKTKKQKIIAAYRNRLQQLKTLQPIEKINIVNKAEINRKVIITPKINISSAVSEPSNSDKVTTQYFFSDLKKSLLIIVFIIALEFVLYFATINNYLSGLIKF